LQVIWIEATFVMDECQARVHSIEKMQQLNRDPGSCPTQHFIDNGSVAGMTPKKKSGQALGGLVGVPALILRKHQQGH